MASRSWRRKLGLMKRSATLAAAVAAMALVAPAGAVIPAFLQNCTNLNKKYPHGLGRLARERPYERHARDELQAQHEALQARDVVQPRPRPRQGRDRLREGVTQWRSGSGSGRRSCRACRSTCRSGALGSARAGVAPPLAVVRKGESRPPSVERLVLAEADLERTILCADCSRQPRGDENAHHDLARVLGRPRRTAHLLPRVRGAAREFGANLGGAC